MPVGNPTFVAASTATLSSTATWTLSVPSGVSQRDLLLAVTYENSTAAWTIPTGWTQILQKTLSGQIVTVYSKLASQFEASSYTWTASFAVSGSATILAYRNVGSPNFDAETDATALGGTSVTVGSVTTSRVNELIVGIYVADTSVTITSPGTATERAQIGGATTTPLEVSDEIKNAPGATGTRTATSSAVTDLKGILLAFPVDFFAFSSSPRNHYIGAVDTFFGNAGISAGSAITDMFAITGSPSRIVTVVRIQASVIQAGVVADMFFVKRSSPSTGGITIPSSRFQITNVDPVTNPPPSTASLIGWSKSPTVLGADVATVGHKSINTSSNLALENEGEGSFVTIFSLSPDPNGYTPGVVLNGPNEAIVVTFDKGTGGTSTPLGMTLFPIVEWIETG